MECIQAESWHIPKEIGQRLPKIDESDDGINWEPVASLNNWEPAESLNEISDTRAVMLDQGKQLNALWRIVKSQKEEIERLDEIANLLYELIELRTIDK